LVNHRKKKKLGCEKEKELATAGCRKAEINNTVSCK
jgi:hypothetical protein